MTHHLLAPGVLMQQKPHTDTVMRRSVHALVDKRLALLVVVEVGNNVNQTVEEYNRRLHLVYRFEGLAPSVFRLGYLAKPKYAETVLLCPFLPSHHLIHSQHDQLRVSLLHLGVDIEHFRLWYLAAQFVFQTVELALQYRHHELREGEGLAVSGLPC